MLDIHEETIEAWCGTIRISIRRPRLRIWPKRPPSPRRRVAVAALLRGTGLSSDWLDGYLTGIVIVPKMIMPNQWLPRILGRRAQPRIDPSRFQRFMDLLMMLGGCRNSVRTRRVRGLDIQSIEEGAGRLGLRVF